MKVYLIGYMGSGKSTIGALVAEQSGLKFLDTDIALEEKFDRSISCIFSSAGENAFRKAEDEYLISTMQIKNVIIACGGGMPCREQNIELIRNEGLSIYLRYDSVTLAQRLTSVANERPLLAGMDKDGIVNFVKDHLESREYWYRQADVTIDADKKSIDSLAGEVIGIINKFKPGKS